MKSISGDLLQLFQSVERCASSQGISPWLVGGAVRDILLGNQPTDYDFAVEGNAIDLASSVAKEIGGEIRSHKRFYTATLLLKTPLNGGITEIDFASTREEYYPSPGSLPEVKLSDINHDLLRRDFTVNAMAISLANLLDPRGNSFSNLVLDPYGGKEDLKAKKIEVIHSKSFIDDPTRMLRACRYAIRIGGLIGKRTEELLQKALQDGAIDYVSYQRIDRELYKALDDPCAKEILSLMTNHSLLSRIGYFDPCSEPISQTALEWVIGESNLLEERYERLFALFAKIGSQQETEARLKKAGISKKRIKKIIDMSYELPCKF